MKWLKRLWHDLWNWFSPAPQALRTLKVEDLPDVLDVRAIYLVGEGNYLWFAALVCPCGCAETIFLNLLSGQRPCWRIECHSDGTVSLCPSIWRIRNCHSHFFIRRGQIEWVLVSGARCQQVDSRRI